MKRKNQIFTLICAVLALSVLLAACGGESASLVSPSVSEVDEAVSVPSAAAGAGTLTVQVVSVENGTVTANVGELAQGQMGEMPEGGMPGGEMPEGGTPPDAPSGGEGTPPEMPEGKAPADGNAPSGAPGGLPGFVAGGETVTFTLTDSTAITVESAEGTAAGAADDITAGAVLEVTLDDDGNAATVTVKDLFAGFTGAPPTGEAPPEEPPADPTNS